MRDRWWVWRGEWTIGLSSANSRVFLPIFLFLKKQKGPIECPRVEKNHVTYWSPYYGIVVSLLSMKSYSPSVAASKRPTHSPKSKFGELTLERNDVPVRRQFRVVIRYTILNFCCFISQITVYMLGEHYKVTINQTFTSGTLDLVAISALICISYVLIVMKAHNLKIGNFRISGQHWKDWTVASRLSEVRELTITLSICSSRFYFSWAAFIHF